MKTSCDGEFNPATLRTLLRERPEVFQEGCKCLSGYTERNTSFAVQKAIALQFFSSLVTQGYGILDACNVTGAAMSISAEVVRRWAANIFADYFAYQTTWKMSQMSSWSWKPGRGGILNGFL